MVITYINQDTMNIIKFVFSSLLFYIATISLQAQVVTVNKLNKEPLSSKIDFVMDFSRASIHGLSEHDFAEYEPDWEKDKPTIMDAFRSKANNVLDGAVIFGDFQKSQQTLKIKVANIDTNGFIICDAEIVNNSGNVIFKVENVTGGKELPISLGTKLAMIKIWSNRVGRKFAKILKEEMK